MFREPIDEPEYIPPVDQRFTEISLLNDIIRVWGAHGAHAEVLKYMIKEIYTLREQLRSIQIEREEWQKMYMSKNGA